MYQTIASVEPLDYKELQSDWGLLNYIFDTYRICRQFLKGIHLNLDFWHPHFDPEGFIRTQIDWAGIYQKIIREVRLKNIWAKLLELPLRVMLQKIVNLRRSEPS